MRIIFKLKFFILIIVDILALNSTFAHDHSIINDSIFSDILKEQRRVKIYLPEEYIPDSSDKYDVVYLVDGETHFDDFYSSTCWPVAKNFFPHLY